MSRATLWRFLPIALPVLAALLAAMPTVDLTYQLRAGAEMLATRAIPSIETWTFTAYGTHWLDQEWGSQLFLRLVYDVTGWTGLAVLRAALVGLAFGLVLATVRRRAPRLGAIGAALLVLAVFVLAIDALALRAQLFAIVLFAATLFVLADRARHPRAVWLIPVFAIAWANVHGTFLFAPALCGLAWLADLYDAAGAKDPSHRRSGRVLHQMLIVGLVTTAATLVNPFGFGVWGYVRALTSNAVITERVSEWQPPSPLTVPGLLTWLSVIGVAVLVVVRLRTTWRGPATAGTRRRRAFRASGSIPWPALLTLLLFGGFALINGRGTTWWPFVAAFVIAPWLRPTAAADTAPAPRPTPPLLRRLNALIAAALVLAGVALLPIWRPVGLSGVPAGTLKYAPQDIAGQLTPHARCVGAMHVWNPQAWGSWLEFAAPCNLYAVDSRIELYSAEDWADIDTVAGAGSGWEAVLDRHGVAQVVTNHTTDTALEAALSRSASWMLDYDDCDGAVWLLRALGPSDQRLKVVPLPNCG